MSPSDAHGARRRALRRLVIGANLALLVAFPVAWAAPLMRAGFLPLFGMSEISVLSGLGALWETDRALALLVAVLALAAPYAKTLALAAMHFGLVGMRALPAVALAGRLAMADVFLLALYIVVARGTGVGRIETAWGLYLFTGCVLASLAIAQATARLASRRG